MAVQTGLSEGLAYDRKQFVSLLETDDTEEGIRAFLEDGYEPKFAGR